MKKNKVIAITVIVTLLLSCFSGCSKKETSVGKNTDAPKDSTENKESGSVTSFNYWLPMEPATTKWITSLNDSPAAKRIEEATGMKVNYISPAVNEEVTQMNLLLATPNSMPELVRYDFDKNYNGGVAGAISDGILIDATKLIEENAPNFMAIINSNDDLKKGAYSDDGKIVKFGSIIQNLETQSYPYNGPMLNKNFLDKTGLPVPETIDEWEDVLQAFKKNGVEIPLGNFGNLGVFAGAYGVTATGFFNDNGTVKYGPMEKGYIDYISRMHKWYEEGLIDQDFISKKPGDFRKDFESGISGATSLHVFEFKTAPAVSAAQGIDPVVVVAAPYPVLNKGEKNHFRQHLSMFNKYPIFVTKTAKDPVALIKWVDYFYSPEGIFETNWGRKGVEGYEDTYYEDKDGKKHYTEAITAPENDGMNMVYLLRDACTYWEDTGVYNDPDTGECWAQNGWDTWKKADFDKTMPETICLTPEESSRYSEIMTDITTYVEEMAAKFVMGTESLENIDEYVETIKNMNIAEAIQIQQNALDRYLSR